MDRALTGGVSAGTSLALGLQLLRGLEHHYEHKVSQSALLDICSPPARWFDLHWTSLLIGIFLGLLLGPVLEGLITARVWIYQTVLRQAAQRFTAGGFPERPLFRIL